MKTTKFLFLAFTIFLLPSCLTRPQPCDDRQIEVVFLQMNDVYEIAPSDGGRIGGLARVATILKRLEKENPNTYCVLAGDFLNPSLMGQLKRDGKRISGEQMVQTMNAVGVDVVTFGNHEFDVKMPELQARINESDFAWLGTSVRQVVDNQEVKFKKETADGAEAVPDRLILEVYDRDGTQAKIGLFGTTIDSNPKSFVKYNDFYRRPIEEAKALTATCDVVLGITHLEIEQDKKLAEMMPVTVPIFMGGHDHDQMQVKVRNTTIMKADANAKSVWIHRVKLVLSGKEPQVTIDSEAVAVTDAVPDDPAVLALTEKWTQVQDDLILQIYPTPYEKIYTTEVPLDARESSIRNRSTNFGDILARAMTAGARGEVVGSLINSGSVRIDDQLQGNIYAIDMFRALPFGGGTEEVEMRGSLLEKMLRQGLANKGKGGFLQTDGFRYNQENATWYAGGEAIDPAKTYRVITTDFLLTGLESGMDFFTPDNPDILNIESPTETDDLRSDIRLLVIDYLKKR